MFQRVYFGSECSMESMYMYLTGYFDTCYTNYDGQAYSSYQAIDQYRLSYNGADCTGESVSSVTYLPTSCQPADGLAVLFTYSNVQSDNNGNGGLSHSDQLVLGIVLSFFGGIALAAIAAFLWLQYVRKVPLSHKDDKNGIQV